MKLLSVALTSVGSVAVLFILVKIMGNRELSQFSLFDYVNGITIGSIAAEMATSLENSFLYPLLAMVIYSGAVVALSYAANKSVKLRRFINGKAIILFDNGKIFNENLKSAKMDINEVLVQCRVKGYFKLSDIQTIILEPNGGISILPKSDMRPVTPNDLEICPNQEHLVTNIILDGELLLDNLKSTGHNEVWLKSEMKKQKSDKISDVFLGTLDYNGNLTIYKRNKTKAKEDNYSI